MPLYIKTLMFIIIGKSQDLIKAIKNMFLMIYMYS